MDYGEKATRMAPFQPIETEKRILTEEEIVEMATEKARAAFRAEVSRLFAENERIKSEKEE